MAIVGQPVVMSPIQKATARRMAESKRTVPHFYVTFDVDMEAAVAAIAQLNLDVQPDKRVSMTATVLKAVDMALEEHPQLNSRWEGDELWRIDVHNLGVAIAIPEGLVAPALVSCNRRSLAEIAAALRDLVARTRTGHLRPAEINDATFTVTNLGMHGVTSFTAIINPPQVAILATGQTQTRACVVDGSVQPRMVMTTTLSVDHRVIDGVTAAQFLETLGRFLAAPRSWMTSA